MILSGGFVPHCVRKFGGFFTKVGDFRNPARINTEYLKESGLNVLDHPPYSPDLSLCDFWLFPGLKEMLAGHRFESRCHIGSAVYQCLQHIPGEDYRPAFQKWIDQCKLCVEADGACFEGLR